MRYLAVDFGERRVGLAMCDPSETIVSPLARIDRRNDAQVIDEVLAAVAENEVDQVVIGLPVNMDGTEGPQAKRIRDFAAALAERLSVPMHFQNEQLTSFTADERLGQRDLTRGRHKARQDAIAAAVILEDFLRDKRN